MKNLFLFFIYFTLGFELTLSAQTNIHGFILNTDGKVLSDINILITKPGSSILIAYAVTNEKGFFQTKVNVASDSLDIEISSVNFHNIHQRIANKTQDLHFVLKPEVINLKPVTVRASPIEKQGDTLKYFVSMFAKKEDRSIEDVLRRMPGIEIRPNGQILYQGLPLQKFYIEGLDLMDGRYTIVSKNLPLASVSTVEILENHQPIRILENKISSQQASINLKLKRNITTTGTGVLGVGILPLLWNVNLTPMTFTKKIQFLTSYQTNNTGNDVSKQLKSLTFDNLFSQANRPTENPDLLNILETSQPNIDENRYLDNNIHLLNFNGLLQLKKDYQLRINLYYINDRQNQQSTLLRTLYIANDTLNFTEKMDNHTHREQMNGIFTLTRNVKKNYLNNKLKIQSKWDNKSGNVFTENKNISQKLKYPTHVISNDLQSINQVGKKLVEFRSYISYDQNPHVLTVNPGQFSNIFNQGIPYYQIKQEVNLKRFYTEESAGYSFKWKGLNYTPRLGVSYRQQSLESDILLFNPAVEKPESQDYTNNLDGSQTRIYGQMEIEFRKGRLILKSRLPLNWQWVNMLDNLTENRQNLSQVFFDPHFYANYEINGFWKINGSWLYKHIVGDIDNIYYGYIMRNYRILSKNAAPLLQKKNQIYSLYLSYRNPITSFFNSVSYFYRISQSNLMYSNKTQQDGTTTLQAIQLPNTSYSHNFHGETSKYFSKIKTTITLQVNFAFNKGESLINNETLATKVQYASLIPDLNFRITRWLNSEYSFNASFINSYIENQKKNNITILKHKLNIFAFPTNPQLISFSSEYYHIQSTDNFFVDLLYRYTFQKKKIDLEFRWNNIFNAKNYINYQASDFYVYKETYLLRPSQAMISVKFTF